MATVKEIIQLATKPSEIKALLKFRIINDNRNSEIDLGISALTKSDMDFCFDALTKVSRSFAIVIQQLPQELKEAVGVFYLVLRGLDTVEDDMSLDETIKDKHLRNFYKYCYLHDFRLHGIGDTEDYKLLLANFDKVTRAFIGLKEEYKEVISDICFRMGNGMADYNAFKIQTVQDYDVYCHYVAGLVGNGLSGLFSGSGLEKAELKDELAISNSMGLFLQKTNITRDFLEDYDAGRIFWPNEIWDKHHSELYFYKLMPESTSSVNGLNHMVMDALRHFPDCITYLQQLQNIQVFRFCAIPQLMALATLIELYNNPEVFKRNVKIRKGLTARILMDTTNMNDVRAFTLELVNELAKKMEANSNTPVEMWQYIHQIKTQLGDKMINPVIF